MMTSRLSSIFGFFWSQARYSWNLRSRHFLVVWVGILAGATSSIANWQLSSSPAFVAFKPRQHFPPNSLSWRKQTYSYLLLIYPQWMKQGKVILKQEKTNMSMNGIHVSECEGEKNAFLDRTDQHKRAAQVVLEEFGFRDEAQQGRFREMPTPTRAQAENHAIFGSLMTQPGLVEEYRVFRHVQEDTEQTENNQNKTQEGPPPLVMAAVRLGPKLNGHDGIVHGGILALLIDDVLGFSYEALPVDPPELAVTANLNVNFRHPLSPHTQFIIQSFLQERQGRKLVFAFRVTSPDEKILYCEGTSIYVIPKQYEN